MGKKLFVFLWPLFIISEAMGVNTVKVDGINYEFNSATKTAKCTGVYDNFFPENIKSIWIKDKITVNNESYTVTSIGDYAFNGFTYVTTLYLPETVEEIGTCAFFGCQYLPEVTLPKNLINIGDGAFQKCKNIKTIEIPSGVTTIGRYAFLECHALETVKINAKLKAIEFRCFDECKSLTSINIPSTVESLGQSSFKNCSSLKKLTIPADVYEIGDRAFEGCESLDDIVLPEKIKYIGEGTFHYCRSLSQIVIPSSVESIGKEAFMFCEALETVEMKYELKTLNIGGVIATSDRGVQTIDEDAFNNCINLTTVKLPKTVTKIGDFAFYDCWKLNVIHCENPDPPRAYYGTFSGVNRPACSLYVPEASIDAYKNTSPWDLFFIQPSPDDNNAVESIYSEDEYSRIHSLNGIKIRNKSALSKGIYIINGKKRVVR